MLDRLNLKGVLLDLAGLFLCTGPALIAVLAFFPLWRDAGDGRIISGGVLILVILAHVPLIKALKRVFSSPSSHLMWLTVFLLFFVLSKIAHEVTVISLVGFIGNLLGAVCFKFSRMKGSSREK